MTLKEITVERWRNISSQTFKPSEGTNLLFGRNGEGKTNYLEAVCAAVSQRYFRTQKAKEIIGWGQLSASAIARLEVGGQNRELEVVLSEKKAFRLDGKDIKRDSNLLAPINAVVFSPEDTKLIKSEPSERRKYIDRAVFLVQRSYAKTAIEYQNAIRSRNFLLKNRSSNKLIESYNEILSIRGSEIAENRQRMVSQLQTYLRETSQLITLPNDVDIKYKIKGRSGSSREEILERLEKEQQNDMERGYTTVGPHTDDIQVLVDGRDAEKSCSQGQIRSISFALKITEARILIEQRKETPLLLLDDIASELDEQKRRELQKVVEELKCQTIITTTERDQLPWRTGRKDWVVEGGKIREV